MLNRRKQATRHVQTGELEKIVVEQLRSLLRHPDVIAHTFREVCASADSGPGAAAVSRLDELRGRRHQTEQAARSLLNLNDPEGNSSLLGRATASPYPSGVSTRSQSVPAHLTARSSGFLFIERQRESAVFCRVFEHGTRLG
jgi:hypothetical protein